MASSPSATSWSAANEHPAEEAASETRATGTEKRRRRMMGLLIKSRRSRSWSRPLAGAGAADPTGSAAACRIRIAVADVEPPRAVVAAPDALDAAVRLRRGIAAGARLWIGDSAVRAGVLVLTDL